MKLKKILKGVSRSFYLSLVLLPKRIRWPMSLAFLACKAADTIADTKLIPKSERLKLLDAYRELFSIQADGFAKDIANAIAKPGGGSGAENALIQNLPALMEAFSNLPAEDWTLIQELVLELTQGMQMDLTYFSGETEKELRAFRTMAELEQYIYYVAGCVGRFWTRMVKQHYDFAKNFGEREEAYGEKLGKGLQLVNVLRDLPRDLRQGRCYIPKELWPRPEEFLFPANIKKLRPVLLPLSNKAKEYLKEYETYSALFPPTACRLKMAVKLPARLGFQTLKLLENSKDWLDPNVVHKVSRRQVYQTLLRTFFA